MQKETSLYIPKPCHENWNTMTPTEQGKFCSACSKQVIDFSLMSDNQVLNFLSTQTGKVCGRFDTAQLERPLIETKVKKKKSWWMALAMPLLFLFDRSEAQDNKVVGDTIYLMPEKDTIAPTAEQGLTEILLGKIAVSDSVSPVTNLPRFVSTDNTRTISGKIVDVNDEPVPRANIIIKNTSLGTIADDSGNFSLTLKNNDANVTLVVSCIGFQSKEINISDSETDEIIQLEVQYALTGDVVVIGYTPRICKSITGATSIITRVTSFQKADTSFRKAIGISNVYPNPAVVGSIIHLKIKEVGDYQLQLFDNKSRLITIDNINTISDKSVADFTLPSNISAGIYYLRLINERTKKSYTEKLLIQ